MEIRLSRPAVIREAIAKGIRCNTIVYRIQRKGDSLMDLGSLIALLKLAQDAEIAVPKRDLYAKETVTRKS